MVCAVGSIHGTSMNMNSEWLRQLLTDFLPGTASAAIRVELIGVGYGLASYLFRCRWSGTTGSESVVVKLWDAGGVGGAREVEFYRAFAGDITGMIPRCYHSAVDDERGHAALVLEDLGEVIQGDCLQPLTLARAVALAEVLAAVHATWWEHPSLHTAEWLPSVARLELGADWFEPRRALFLQRFGDRLEERTHGLLAQIEEVQARANEQLAGAAATLVHGDFHLDNVVFRAASEDPVLLDWARVARGPGVLDVIELFLSLEKPAYWQRLLAAYLAGLRAEGVSQVDEVVLRKQLGGALLRKFISATCGVANWQPASPREARIIDAGLARVQRAIEDWERDDPKLFQL
jgi:hypothetical protein